MKHRLINDLIRKNSYQSYLEIGYGQGMNYRHIMCKKKIAVDPALKRAIPNVKKMRSDQFFKENKEKFDVIFIDGLHHADQVRDDINNASKVLNKNGCILLHDTIPPTEKSQRVPREQSQWTGDVWRAVYGLVQSNEIEMYTKKADYGLTFIFPKGEVFTGQYEDMKTSYDNFKNEIKEALNIK